MASTMLHEKCCNAVLQIGAPLEKLGLVDQNWLERNLSALLLRTLVVGRRQHSEFKKNLNASKPAEHPPQVEQCLKV